MSEAFERIRGAIANRPDTEHEVALFRLMLVPLVGLFFLLGGLQSGQGVVRWINALCIGYAMFALIVANQVLSGSGISYTRRVVSIFADQAFFAGVLAALGEEGAPFLSMFLLVSIDNALRYGRRYGYLASFAGALAFLAVHATNDFWHASGKVGLSWLIAMLIVPPYVWTFSQRIKRVGHRYRRRAQKMARVALEDPLTGLANRAAFNQHLSRAVTAAQLSNGGNGFAVLYIDLDGFKSVNDTPTDMRSATCCSGRSRPRSRRVCAALTTSHDSAATSSRSCSITSPISRSRGESARKSSIA